MLAVVAVLEDAEDSGAGDDHATPSKGGRSDSSRRVSAHRGDGVDVKYERISTSLLIGIAAYSHVRGCHCAALQS